MSRQSSATMFCIDSTGKMSSDRSRGAAWRRAAIASRARRRCSGSAVAGRIALAAVAQLRGEEQEQAGLGDDLHGHRQQDDERKDSWRSLEASSTSRQCSSTIGVDSSSITRSDRSRSTAWRRGERASSAQRRCAWAAGRAMRVVALRGGKKHEKTGLGDNLHGQ
jgi:Ni/Co efflux regulator RcnB